RYEIKPDPGMSQVVGFSDRFPIVHQPGISNRHHVILPVLGNALYTGDHVTGLHLWAGWKFASLILSGDKNFDVGSSYINHQYFHDRAPPRAKSSYCPPPFLRAPWQTFVSAGLKGPLGPSE